MHYGSGGAGGLTHVAMELLRERIGHPMLVHVPCRSASAALAKLAANRFGMMFARLPVAAPFLQAGQLRGVLSTGPARIPGLAIAGEQGLAEFSFQDWIGLFAPRGTPLGVIARLNAALTATLGEPATRQLIQARGDESGGTPERLAQALAEDDARWGHVARANSIRPEG